MEFAGKRLLYALAGVMGVTLLGSTGYYLIGEGRWELVDCIYMTLITLSTVGYREIVDVNSVPSAKLFTMALIVIGMGTWVFFITSFTAFLVEGEILDMFKRRRTMKRLNNMKDHMVVCGAGQTGYHSVLELLQVGREVVVVDKDLERLEKLEKLGAVLLQGDATEEEILKKAAVDRAKGLIATLSDDAANLFVTITARELNPELKIIARAVDINTMEKLKKVGADSVVSPNRLGGLRMASELLRPTVVTFMDQMVRTPGSALRMEEVQIKKGSRFEGRTLKDSKIRELADLLVVAVKRPENHAFLYNPSPDYVLTAGDILVVLGRVEDAKKLREIN